MQTTEQATSRAALKIQLKIAKIDRKREKAHRETVDRRHQTVLSSWMAGMLSDADLDTANKDLRSAIARVKAATERVARLKCLLAAEYG